MYSLADKVGARAVASPVEVLAAADLTLFTVPDDVIVPLATLVAHTSGALSGKAVIHTSGSHGTSSLSALAARGAAVGGLHPAFPFADIETSIARLPGATFAIETDDQHLDGWLHALVAALDGRVLMIPHGQKALYHAALTIASNYLVTLYALAENVLLSLGADREAAAHALNVLVGTTADNLRLQGTPAALTGALVRGDVGTVAAHRAALALYDAQIAKIYVDLARLTLPLLEARGVPLNPIQEVIGNYGTADRS
jgi:predicted short-subunit dehydrogenase-like oxidoreductase (DUF2520 family)